MVTHTKLQFEAVVAGLNQAFDGWMVFQLAGSLSDTPASFHDADIIVYPKLSSGAKGFLQGCRDAGIEIVALDDASTTPSQADRTARTGFRSSSLPATRLTCSFQKASWLQRERVKHRSEALALIALAVRPLSSTIS